METSPTSRALRTLEILQLRPGITADDLADRLGVTSRAARRYVAILREADIPVESVRGPYGGYRLGRGVRLPPLVFTPTEALGLVMAVLDGHHAAADADDPVGSALGKLLRSLPETVSGPATTMREHASAAPVRRSRPSLEITSDLVAAVAEQRQVRVTYRSGEGRQWDAVVDPWAVVVRHGLWYLVCRSHPPDAVRTYRVDRVLAVEPLDDPFVAPDDLDPVRLLEEHLARGWDFATRVVVDAPLARVAPFVRAPMGRLTPLDDDTTLLEGSTNNPEMYAGEWLAALPFPFRVEDGPELRAAMTDLVAKLAASVE